MKAVRICVLFTVSLVTGQMPVLADDTLTALALSGQVVPGTSDTFFAYLDAPPVINNLGQVAFHANYVPPSGTWREGIWTNAGNDGGRFVVSSGDQVPGAAAGVKFGTLSFDPKLNDLGQIAFNGPGKTAGYASGIWLFDQGQISSVVVSGEAATATGPNRTFANFGEVVLNNSGAMAFQAHARLPDVNQPWSSAVWKFRNGTVNPVVVAGATVPARAGNRNIDSYTDPSSYSVPFGRIAINSDDDVLFTAKLNTGGYGGDPSQDSGIWKVRGTSVSLVDQEKSTGFRDSDFVDRRVAPSVNGRGHVAFGMCTAGDSRCSSGGAWISDGNTLTPLALIGQTVAIDGHDYTFTGGFGLTAMNDNDQVAFAADYLDSITGVTQPGIWLSSTGHLQLIGGIFDGLPGLYPSQSIYGNYPPSGITINNRGQVAFETGLGIWATDRAGVLRLVAIRGQRIDVENGPGENWQTINGLRANLNDRDSGRAQGFNDRGELVFQVKYSLYSTAGGIFLSRVATIPEPSTGALSCLFLATVAGWRFPRAKKLGPIA